MKFVLLALLLVGVILLTGCTGNPSTPSSSSTYAPQAPNAPASNQSSNNALLGGSQTMNLSDVQALGTPMQCVGQVPERPPANVFIKGMNIRVDWATRPGEKPAMGSTTTTYVNGTTDWLVANISGPPWHYPNYPNPNCDYVMYMSNDYLDNDTLLSMLPVNLTCSHANFGDEAFRFPPKTCTYDEATTAPGS